MSKKLSKSKSIENSQAMNLAIVADNPWGNELINSQHETIIQLRSQVNFLEKKLKISNNSLEHKDHEIETFWKVEIKRFQDKITFLENENSTLKAAPLPGPGLSAQIRP